MSKQLRQLYGENEIIENEKYNNININEELDYIYETEERARVARETKHKVAMRQVSLKHALVCDLMSQ